LTKKIKQLKRGNGLNIKGKKNFMPITKAKCKREDSADLKYQTLNKHRGLLNV
jgi:hypothetical protein